MLPSVPPTTLSRRHRHLRLVARSGLAVAMSLGVLATAPTAGAVVSSDLAAESRVSLGGEVSATATRGDVLYVGGQFGAIGLRAAGIVPTDATTGALDRSVPELAAGEGASFPSADRVVADRDGGVYVLNISTQNTGTSLPEYDGEPVPARWLHLDQAGRADGALADRFTTGEGDERAPARMADVAVAADGTTYFAGTFTAVDGQARGGVAAIGPDGKLLPFDPKLTRGDVAGENDSIVNRIVPAGDSVLLVGAQSRAAFSAVGGQPRRGLALVAASTGAVRSWNPEDLTQADAVSGAVVEGSNVLLASIDAVRAVPVTDSTAVRDLRLQPQDGRILGIAARAGRLYVVGGFTAIGSQASQPTRPGLAEIDPATGQATAWDPPATRGSASVALSADTVYIGGDPDSTGGSLSCGEAFSLSSAAKTAWDPRITQGGSECSGVGSLAVSGDRVWNAGTGIALANARARGGLAAIDVAKDEILPWAPRRAGERTPSARDLTLSPDGATAYIADTGMETLNGVARRKVAAVSTTGAATSADDVRAWDPAPGSEEFDYGVERVQPTADGQTVLLAGAFQTVGGANRPNLAATSASTGAPTAWNPAPNARVDALELAGDGTFYLGGQFTTIGSAGTARRYLAAFSGPTADAPTAWDPQLAEEASPFPPAIQDLALGEGVVYAAGSFDGQIGGKTRRSVAALNRTDGKATDWDADVNGDIVTVSTTADGTVYLAADGPDPVGGLYAGPFSTVQGQNRFGYLASVSGAGTVTGWNPGNAQENAPTFAPAAYNQSTEIREVGGAVVVPGRALGFQGTVQQGIFAFGSATAPPVVRTPPTVTGRRVEAGRLTCKAGSYAGGSVTRSYVWLRNGAPISGAVGASYVVRDADVGKDVACEETVRNAVGPLTTTSAAVRIVAAPPASDVAPEVVGSPAIGQIVRCTEGLWSNVPTGYAYRWLRDGAAIGSATGETYAITGADGGRGLACEVTATNDAGASSPARSAAVRVPAPPVDPGPGPGPDPGPGPGPGTPTTTTPTTTTPTTTTPGPPPKTPVAKPKLAVSAKAVAAKGRKVTLTVSPSAAGRVTVAASTGTGKKRVTVGSGSATAKKAGSLKLTVKPSSKGKKALKAGRTAKIAFKVTFTRADGQKITVTRTIKVKIKR
jgi:hypothetical protein